MRRLALSRSYRLSGPRNLQFNSVTCFQQCQHLSSVVLSNWRFAAIGCKSSPNWCWQIRYRFPTGTRPGWWVGRRQLRSGPRRISKRKDHLITLNCPDFMRMKALSNRTALVGTLPAGPPLDTVGEPIMLDTIFLIATVAFFVLAIAYVWGCEKL